MWDKWIQPLLPEAKEMVDSKINTRDESVVLVNQFALIVTVEHFSTLSPEKMLSDMIINFYMEILQERDEHNCVFWPVEFFGKIFSDPTRSVPTERIQVSPSPDESVTLGSLSKRKQKSADPPSTKRIRANILAKQRLKYSDNNTGPYNYLNVEGFTRKKDFNIFEKRKHFFPVFRDGDHFALLMVDMELYEINYYDSLAKEGKVFIDAAKSWVLDEGKKYDDFVVPAFGDFDHKKDVPLQRNCVDCGVYMLANIEILSKDLELPSSFTDEEILEYRRMIGFAILNPKGVVSLME
jgi:Ulp1 family protease